jgi:predicted glycosyltransferase
MRVSVLFYVQHLLGIGHLARASLIALALKRQGLEVVLVLGGPPVPGFPDPSLEAVQLPPVKMGAGGFSELAGPDNRPVSSEYLARRRDRLLAIFQERRPDVVLLETYPFGRRQMRFELEPLLELALRAPWRPLIASSVRDILQEGRKPQRLAEARNTLKAMFGLVLVHGDPEFVPLEATFPPAGEVAHLIRYTGIVTGPVPELIGEPFDVVVSAGGGAAGLALMRAAREALSTSALSTRRWCFITGPNLPEAERTAIFGNLPEDAVATAHRRDFRALLAAAKLSVSQAGYNTVADVLQAGCRAVLVPFSAGGETEQSRRAAALQSRGLARVISEAELSGPLLAAKIEQAMALDPPSRAWRPRLDGAETCGPLLIEALSKARREKLPSAGR